MTTPVKAVDCLPYEKELENMGFESVDKANRYIQGAYVFICQ